MSGWVTISPTMEAIFGTRPWRVAGEGPTELAEGSFTDAERPGFTAEDIRFTSRHDHTGDYLYATALAWPADGRLRIRSLGSAAGLLAGGIAAVRVLGFAGEVQWDRRTGFLEVRLPVRPHDRPQGRARAAAEHPVQRGLEVELVRRGDGRPSLTPQRLEVELGLAAEVAGDQGGVHAGPGADLAHRRRLEALLGEELVGGLQQPGSAVGRVVPAGPGCGGRHRPDLAGAAARACRS